MSNILNPVSKQIGACFICMAPARRGQACRADYPENAKETSQSPAQPAEDTPPAFFWPQSDSLYHVIAWLHTRLLPPRSLFRLPQVEMFPCISLFTFIGCWRGVVTVGGGCLATVKAHACDILRILLIQMECMHKLCFGNYLFKLFKKCMSKHPYQYLVLCIFNLNCKLTLQSLVFEFSVGVKPNISPGLDHLCQHDSEAGPWMNLMS